MKVALLTHHWVPNFGANLQAYSTFHTLRKLSHDVTIINYRRPELVSQYAQRVPDRQCQAHYEFIDRNTKQTPVVQNSHEIIDYCKQEKYDLIIAGSDSIFRINKEMNTDEGPFPNPYWLDWCKDLRCRTAILAASTMGSMLWTLPLNTRKKMRQVLNSYDYISVRDRWSRLQLSFLSYLQVIPSICPDPVSVINGVLPSGISSEKRDKYVIISMPAVYIKNKIISIEWIKEFKKHVNSNGFILRSLPTPEEELLVPADEIIKHPVTPIDWYMFIKNASGVISDRFHPLACSIYNLVPCLSIDINTMKCFKSIPVRMRSKQYDLCINAKRIDSCVLIERIKDLDPAKAFHLMMRPVDSCYVNNSSNQFMKTIHQILGS